MKKQKPDKFIRIDCDIDYRNYERSFTGRLTPGRAAIIQRYCEQHTWHQNCGHEWDCCGCCFAQNAGWKYAQNQVTVRITESFNY